VDDTLQALGPAIAAAAEEVPGVRPDIVAGCLRRIEELAASPLG
jgi:hypothetical protein